MKTAVFRGNHREIGRQAGVSFLKNPYQFFDYPFDDNLYRSQMEIYQKHYPELLEEIKGIAETINIDFKKIVYLLICSEIQFFTDLLKIPRGCTIFGIRNKKGVFVGRNYDWEPSAANNIVGHTFINSERYSYESFTDTGIGSNMAEDAVNDRGLYIGLTFADNHKWSYGLSSLHICRLIAETCTTVDEALAVFSRVPMCCPKNYFIADKAGDMAVVEHTSKRFKILYPKNDILIQTNHYVDPGLAEEDMALRDTTLTDTFLRYYETLQRLNMQKEKFGYPDIMKLLTQSGSYVFHNHPNVRTLWSLALDMKNSHFRVYWNLTGRRRTRLLVI
jgi:predicted choloylglycine hydrolase